MNPTFRRIFEVVCGAFTILMFTVLFANAVTTAFFWVGMSAVDRVLSCALLLTMGVLTTAAAHRADAPH